MADVQPEHGHLRVANDLWDAIAAARLNRGASAVLMAVYRQSYGFGRKTTGSWLSLSFLQRYTGLSRTRCSKALSELRTAGMIVRVREGDTSTASEYAPVKDYAAWSDAVLPDGWSPVGSVRNVTSDAGDTSDAGGTRGSDAGGTTQKTRNREEEHAREARPDHDPSRRWNLAALWGQLAPRFGAGNTAAPRQPDAINAARLMDIIDASTDDDIDARLALCAGKGSPLGYFVALFDADGSPNPLIERRKNSPMDRASKEDRAIALRSDAHDLADVLQATGKDCPPENVAYWIDKHGRPWTVDELRPMARRVLIVLGIAA